MSFGHPLLLLTLLVVPAAIACLVLAERRRMRYAVRFTNLDVLAAVAGGRSFRRYVPVALFLLAVAAACVAVARPHAKTLVPQERATVILVIDVSRSMDASDVKPTRLLAAQSAVRSFLDRVPKRVRDGLIAFAGIPSVVTPPTTDRELLKNSLQYIADYGGFGGTAIGDAVAAAVQLGEQAVSGSGNLAAVTTAPTGAAHGLVSVLFLSDGAQTRGDLLPLQGAERAKAAGIPVYTVALGTPGGTLSRDPNFGGGGFPGGGGGSGGGGGGGGFGFGNIPVPPDPTTLRAIADRTGGQFFEAHSSKAVKAAYAKLGSKLGRRPAKTEITFEFLAVAAALLVAAGVLSARWSPRLP